MVLITDVSVSDVRFPTSELHWGSDAMHPDPDYSCVYVCIHTDTMMNEKPLCGYGLTFTIGRGNEVVMNAVVALKHCVVGLTLESITSNFAQVWRNLASDTQLRWLGPEKGVIHLATGVIVNTIWDLWARSVSKPLWRLLCDLTPAQLVSTIDFRWITDIITPQEALEMLEKQRPHHASRIAHLEANGYPAYTTSAGWLGFTEQQLRELCRQGVKEGWTHFKIKVGNSLEDDINRLEIIRSEIGWERKLMIDANQRWDVGQAIEYVKALAKFKPWFIEEPTSPDDILGHATIRAALAPHGVAVATGEVCANRVIFKQMLQAKALDVLQIDACRIGGVNEILAVLLMANKCGVQVCPHAGGVGLCQYVQHLSIFDHIAVSGRINIIEYVTHLHEHFVTPVQVKNGCYIVPTTPGYSIEMLESSVRDFGYPSGSEWLKRSHKKFETEAKIDVVTGASPPPGSTYLITGGCGFIGAWIIHRLLAGIHAPRPTSIIILDVKRDLSILEQILTRDDINTIKFETGDISDNKFVNRVFQEHTITHVIHLAGLQVPTCRANPSAGAMVNVVGTVNVFQAAITFGQKRVQNIVYASSAAVCGPPEDYVGTVKDDGDHKPTTHYGVFKLCNEANARIFWRDNRLPSVGLRPLTVFGVGRELGMTSAPTKAMKAAILGRNYVLPFKGLTSFNDVVDIAELFILASQRCREGAHTCNIKGNATTVEQFMSLVEEVLPSSRGKFTFDPSAGTIPFPSDFDETTLTSIVGKVPLTPLRDSIARTVQHFQTLASQQRLHARDL